MRTERHSMENRKIRKKKLAKRYKMERDKEKV